jgi:hypothetical protein
MNLAKITGLSLLTLTVLAAGCNKKIQLTIANHSDVARTIQMSTPEETMNVGAVSPGGRMKTTLSVKTSDLPADCYLSAEGGAKQTFTVTEDSPSKWWFHVSADGTLAGPYGEKDVHAETTETTTITVPIGTRTVVK